MSHTLPTAWTEGPGPDEVFAKYLQSNEFRIQHCCNCDAHIYYPRLVCNQCGSVDLEWVPPSGRGIVHSVSLVNRRVEKGGPYNVVLVDLAEGPRMMSRVDGMAHEDVHIGLSVQAQVADGVGGEPCVAFVAAEGAIT